MKKFTPPTLDEFKAYIAANPDLKGLNAERLFRGYNDGGWIDTQGKPVRNWKLKLWTLASYSGGQYNRKSAQQREEEKITAKRTAERAQTEMTREFERRSKGRVAVLVKHLAPVTPKEGLSPAEFEERRQKAIRELEGVSSKKDENFAGKYNL